MKAALNIIIFAAGVGVGFAAAITLGKKRYSEALETEIAEIKKFYKSEHEAENNEEQRCIKVSTAKALREKGLSLKEIAEKMGYSNDTSVRSLLGENSQDTIIVESDSVDIVKDTAEEKKEYDQIVKKSGYNRTVIYDTTIVDPDEMVVSPADAVHLTYGDGVLCDMNGDTVDVNLIGKEAIELLDDGEDLVYVYNENLDTTYSVTKI